MKKFKGVFYAVISAISFGLSPILIAISYQMGNNSMMMAFVRNLLVLPFLFFYIKFRRISLTITKDQLFKLIAMNVFGTCLSLTVLYISYNYIPVSLATSIHFIYPSIVAVLSVIIFKEYMSGLRKLAVASSLIGIALFIDFKAGSSNFFLGISLALVSGMAYAFYIIFMAKSGVLKLENIVILYYSCLISAIFLGGLTLAFDKLVIAEIALEGWALIFLISIMLTFLGTMFTQLAITNLGATRTSVLATLEPITTIVLGVTLFDEKIGLIKLIACFMILLAVLLLALDQRKMAKIRAKNIEKYEDIIA
ncbi:MAG: DMT family transporter [Tissierellia bacterium]|nr:DMT family transporter [Tissierellia bacterium]